MIVPRETVTLSQTMLLFSFKLSLNESFFHCVVYLTMYGKGFQKQPFKGVLEKRWPWNSQHILTVFPKTLEKILEKHMARSSF